MRKRMVTRTMVTTKAIVMCLEIETGESVTRDFTIAGTFTSKDKLLKELKKLYDIEEKFVLVYVIDVEEEKALYGMLESDFFNYSEKLPTREKTTAENSEESED